MTTQEFNKLTSENFAARLNRYIKGNILKLILMIS